MLLLKGKLTYRNLNTTYTHIDQFVVGLQKERFTGYCTLSYWEYDAVLFFVEGKVVNGREESGLPADTVRSGETAIANIIEKGKEKGGELNAYALAAERITLLVTALDAAPKYENLSTDLTSLERVMSLAKKEALSGYIEIVFEEDAGIANLFLVEGSLNEALFAPVDNRMLGDVISLDDVLKLGQQHGAIFNVYQATAMSSGQGAEHSLEGPVPDDALRLFEALLVHLESVVDGILKPEEFQTTFKKMLPHAADTYDFLDPFLGDFRYNQRTLSYSGDASYKEFLDGMCEVVNGTLATLLEAIPKATLLPRISTNLESVTTPYGDLIEHLQLETRLPDIFQDYAFIREADAEQTDEESTQARSLLNLQSVGVPKIASESILREFYRVINLIAQNYVAPENNAIQYARLRKSSEYQQYQTATALLQNFNVPSLKTRGDALAFWLNLYNFLVIDGILKSRVTTSVQDVKGFFSKNSYRLGAHVFSLDEIEHGVLRNNQRRPYSLFRPFGGTDPRQAFCFDPPDVRVHCCFMSGAISSPGLYIYMPKQLNTQLTQAVNRFLSGERGMRVNLEKKEVWLNRTLYWYRKDFEQKGKHLIDFVVEQLAATEVKQYIVQNRKQITLRFMDYDWRLNEQS